jgi:hypothetical protein
VRIKALPLSQSKQEKRTEGVITIQRGKDSWNQRPQTSGSSTPPLTRAPRTRARLHAHYHHPRPPLQRTTTAAPPPLQRTHRHHCCRQHQAPPFPSVACAATWHLLHHHHSALEHHLAYRSPIKLPHQLPQLPTRSKHTPDKSPLPNRKQLHFPLPRP